jgi:hypothetical protein
MYGGSIDAPDEVVWRDLIEKWTRALAHFWPLFGVLSGLSWAPWSIPGAENVHVH